MGGEWPIQRLGDVIELKRGYDLPSSKRIPGDIPVISSSGSNGNHSSAMAKAPGVVTGRYGTLGKVHFVSQDYWPLNTTLYVKNFKGSVPRFVAYFLKTLDFHAYSDKAAVPGLNRNDLHTAEVLWPPIGDQAAIADLLGVLDDKIELNRRMAGTLEAMARALFKSWFVDFDPVRAKAEGRPTGLPEELAALFPACITSGGLPKGWESRSLYDFAVIIYGAPFSSKSFNDDGVGLPLIRVRDLADHDPSIFTDEQHRLGHTIHPGDVVIGMDGEFRAHMWRGPRSYLNQRVCHVEPNEGVSETFVMLALEEPLARFEAGAVGTTVIHLGKRDLDTVHLVWPGLELLSVFKEIAGTMLEQVVASTQQNRTLAGLRDALLPKLISGELRVGDAAAEISAA